MLSTSRCPFSPPRLWGFGCLETPMTSQGRFQQSKVSVRGWPEPDLSYVRGYPRLIPDAISTKQTHRLRFAWVEHAWQEPQYSPFTLSISSLQPSSPHSFRLQCWSPYAAAPSSTLATAPAFRTANNRHRRVSKPQRTFSRPDTPCLHAKDRSSRSWHLADRRKESGRTWEYLPIQCART